MLNTSENTLLLNSFLQRRETTRGHVNSQKHRGTSRSRSRSYLLSQLSQPVGLTDTKEASRARQGRDATGNTNREHRRVRKELRESKARHCVSKRAQRQPGSCRHFQGGGPGGHRAALTATTPRHPSRCSGTVDIRRGLPRDPSKSPRHSIRVQARPGRPAIYTVERMPQDHLDNRTLISLVQTRPAPGGHWSGPGLGDEGLRFS